MATTNRELFRGIPIVTLRTDTSTRIPWTSGDYITLLRHAARYQLTAPIIRVGNNDLIHALHLRDHGYPDDVIHIIITKALAAIRYRVDKLTEERVLLETLYPDDVGVVKKRVRWPMFTRDWLREGWRGDVLPPAGGTGMERRRDPAGERAATPPPRLNVPPRQQPPRQQPPLQHPSRPQGQPRPQRQVPPHDQVPPRQSPPPQPQLPPRDNPAPDDRSQRRPHWGFRRRDHSARNSSVSNALHRQDDRLDDDDRRINGLQDICQRLVIGLPTMMRTEVRSVLEEMGIVPAARDDEPPMNEAPRNGPPVNIPINGPLVDFPPTPPRGSAEHVPQALVFMAPYTPPREPLGPVAPVAPGDHRTPSPIPSTRIPSPLASAAQTARQLATRFMQLRTAHLLLKAEADIAAGPGHEDALENRKRRGAAAATRNVRRYAALALETLAAERAGEEEWAMRPLLWRIVLEDGSREG